MNRFFQILLLSVVFVGIAFVSANLSIALSRRQAAFDVCRLIERNYYRSQEEETQIWLQDCWKHAQNQPQIVSTNEAIGSLNDLLASLGVSHLFLYTPDENREIWENEAVDTGIRALNIEGQFIVSEVIEGSVAQMLGVNPGDEIVFIDNELVGNARQLNTAAGEYLIRRGEKELRFKIQPQVLSLDMSPKLKLVRDNIGILRIQSFLAQYFDAESWTALAEQIKELDYLVIDLRGNGGGSFPSMLRALSVFSCRSRRIGTLFQPTPGKSEEEQDLSDDLEAESQLDQLRSVKNLHLRTFTDYPCYSGDVVVLIDGDTNSVAEIFADSFFDRTHSEVWGQPSAGQVVMARWFPLAALGRGDYSISIPIAGYRNARGNEIEAAGVVPEKVLSYDLKTALKGEDSWLKSALSEFAQ